MLKQAIGKSSDISIHALRVEGDQTKFHNLWQHFNISIHALRVEGDGSSKSRDLSISFHFYPRPPGGGRHQKLFQKAFLDFGFLSTPSGWRATVASPMAIESQDIISIHALRVEGDNYNYR